MKYLKNCKDCFLYCLSKNVIYSAYAFRKENRGGNTCFYNARTVAVLAERHYQALFHFLIITSIPKSLIYHSRGLNKNAFRQHVSLLRIMKHYTSTSITR